MLSHNDSSTNDQLPWVSFYQQMQAVYLAAISQEFVRLFKKYNPQCQLTEFNDVYDYMCEHINNVNTNDPRLDILLETLYHSYTALLNGLVDEQPEQLHPEFSSQYFKDWQDLISKKLTDKINESPNENQMINRCNLCKKQLLKTINHCILENSKANKWYQNFANVLVDILLCIPPLFIIPVIKYMVTGDERVLNLRSKTQTIARNLVKHQSLFKPLTETSSDQDSDTSIKPNKGV